MKILIIGAGGQDGRILSEIAQKSGHEVFGVTREYLELYGSRVPLSRNLEDARDSAELLDDIGPDAIFNVAAIHASSSEMASLGEKKHSEMFGVHVALTENLLEWQRRNNEVKSVIALSSQMFTSNKETEVIDFTSRINPSTVYGNTKAIAWEKIKKYRSELNVRTSGAILFNHSSRFSKSDFLFMQLANQIVRILNGESDSIILYDANSRIDMCDAYDVCSGMLRILGVEKPADYIFSSGNLVTISQVVTDCFRILNYDQIPTILSSAPRSSNFSLVGDYSYAKKVLGWQPNKTPSQLLADIVVALRAEGV